MKLQTPVEISSIPDLISHRDKLLLIGSCFAGNIGKLLAEGKFDCDLNPMGILYNPLSIAQAVQQLRSGKEYVAEDLFHYRESWHSFMHHSSFSDEDPQKVLDKINGRIRQGNRSLREASWMIVTLGSAWVYEHLLTGEVVGNCHKLPEKEFHRRRLTVGEITERFSSLIGDLQLLNPDMRFLFTVSPIRHVRDGLAENQLSKSTLLLAVDELRYTFPEKVFYFPAYEIMMDELRDYRYYADDMIHPSSLAVRYIWERFVESAVSPDARKVMKSCEEIRQALEHRPFRPGSDEYKKFLRKILLRIDQLNEEYPNLDFQKEKEICHTRLNP